MLDHLRDYSVLYSMDFTAITYSVGLMGLLCNMSELLVHRFDNCRDYSVLRFPEL